MGLLRDQMCVVTGASRGIGRAIALALAKQGAALCLVGRSREALESVADSVRAIGPHVLIFPIDLTIDQNIERLKVDIQREFGRVDVLVHCAGAYSRGSLLDAPVEDIDLLYRANVRVPYLLTQSLLPLLKVCSGQIVFLNSSVGLKAQAGVSQFAATQHALKAIADSLRDEVNRDGIRVLNVFPGRTATPRQANIYKLEGRTYQPELLLQPEDVAAVVINSLNLPRTAEVTEISIRPLIKSY
jgi:NADP-dependent 3-hydroxy acid dehydrogenase YdfG